ncbi:phage tail spike protein [Tepidibacillus sp. LV47]|uniref:phage tail spike protein n=1 Tax=Tepidibacillus sp. LV47 TaxID=3398228 RepID=UPI003AB047FB
MLYDVNHNKIAPLPNAKDVKLERTLDGDEVLSFSYPQSDSRYTLIKEETYVRTENNEYVIKEVNEGEDWTEFVAKINVEDLKGTVVEHFETVEQSATDAVNLALAGTGWTIGSCDVTKLRTVRKQYSNSYDILLEIQKAYSCEMSFDAINKKVYIYQSRGADRGVYFIDKLNLKKLEVQRNSYDFCTRLIPIGKDGLTIESVNGGLNYIENYQYSSKVITAYWEDNRYTNPESLKEDAILRLNELSKPRRAYKADVFDLASISDKYSILDYDLGDTITLIDETKGIKDKQRIVKTIEYLDEPEKNQIEIANRVLSLDDLQVNLIETSETVDSITTTDGQVVGSKIDSVDYAKIKNVSIGTTDIQDAAITSAKIGNAQITTAHITDAAINNAKIATAAVDTANIKDAAITNAKIANAAIDSAKIADASITTAKIVDGSITNAKIANAAIDNAKIADASISTAKIQTGAITTALIGTGAVQTAQIADGSITDAKIVSLTANKITAGTIDANTVNIVNLKADNITTGALTIQPKNYVRNGNFVNGGTNWSGYSDIVDDAIFGKMVHKSVTDGQIQITQYITDLKNHGTYTMSGIVKASDITKINGFGFVVWYTDSSYSDYTWTAVNKIDLGNGYYKLYKTGSTNIAKTINRFDIRIWTGANTTAEVWATNIMFQKGSLATEFVPHVDEQISDGAITNSKIANDAVDGNKIADGAVTNTHIAANTITGDKLVADAITSREIAAGAVTANELAANAITAGSAVIADGAITSAKIGDGQITNAKIANLAVDAAKIADATITGAKIANATITGANIASATIDTANIKDAAITNAKIASLDASKITTGTLDANRIAAGSITADKLKIGTTKTSSLYVRGTGLNRNANRVVKVDEVYLVNGTGRGLTLTILNRSDHSHVSSTNYDVYGDAAARDNLANALNALGNDKIVILTSYDAIRFNSALETAIERCGGGNVKDSYLATNYRLPYILIGIPGIGKGKGVEIFTSTASDAPYAEISTLIVDGTPVGINTGFTNTTIIDGGQITTGTLDASKVNVVNLNASNITTGTLKSITLDSVTGTFSGSLFSSSLYLSNPNIATRGWTGFSVQQTNIGADGTYGEMFMSTFNFGEQKVEFGINTGDLSNITLQNHNQIKIWSDLTIFTKDVQADGDYYLNANHQITSKYNNGPILKDHANGNITLNAAGGSLYLGYYNTGVIYNQVKTFMPYSSGIKGNSTGATNIAYFSFYESDGTTRQGWVGAGSSSNSDIYLAADVGSVRLNAYNSVVYFGSASIDYSAGNARWRRDASNYIYQDGTQVVFYIGGVAKHTFRSDGTKSGGSIVVDGKNYGMSPIDSPRTLISDLMQGINVSTAGTKVYLDSIFYKTINGYSLFFNKNGVEIVEQAPDYFVIKSTDVDKVVDIFVIGTRVGEEGKYYYDLDAINE